MASSRSSARAKALSLELKPGPDARQLKLESDDVIHLAYAHGEIGYSADEPLAAFLWVGRGGLRMKPILTGAPLGIQVEALSAALSSHLGLASNTALLVTDVAAGGMADQGGLKKFDIITGIEGTAAVTQGKLQQMLRRKNSGDELSLSVLRQSARSNSSSWRGESGRTMIGAPQPKAATNDQPDKQRRVSERRSTMNWGWMVGITMARAGRSRNWSWSTVRANGACEVIAARFTRF